MARCEVVQIQCDRCKRVELRPPQPPKARPDMEFRHLDVVVVYADLCNGCAKTMERIAEDIREWQREIKQQFGPTVNGNEAPPMQVAPKYTPAQPHASGVK